MSGSPLQGGHFFARLFGTEYLTGVKGRNAVVCQRYV